MKTLTTIAAMKSWSQDRRGQAATIGFVPTMGFLHEGHLSLIRKARAANDQVVASIFVNPTQFGPNEDLARYPRDPEGDSAKCEESGVDVLFIPDHREIYPVGYQTYVNVEQVSLPLCGANRPGHFRGVATVVLKLFNMIAPNRAYFGMKDFQQVQVIQAMTRDLNLDVEVIPCPIVREQDGLAMSSRNAYLSPVERKQAVALHQALIEARALFHAGENRADEYLRAMRERIERESDARTDYIRLVDPNTLADLDSVGDRALAALAVKFGNTRLIDNMLFERD